jgi:hypothetical protein
VRENNLKEINGVKVANNAIDWNGHEVGRIKIKSLVGKHPTIRPLLFFF